MIFYREGVTAVEEPVDCPNVSRVACTYAAIFQECLQNSGLPIWNRLNNTGFWRQLTVSFTDKLLGGVDWFCSLTSVVTLSKESLEVGKIRAQHYIL